MDIHKPKPWHGIREFLKEYVIIVVGVLTALGAEQAVEWGRTHAELNEARTAIRAEVLEDAKRAVFAEQADRCYLKVLDLYEAWADGGPRPDVPPLVLPYPDDAVWTTARTGPVTHMSLEEKLGYARFYSRAENLLQLDTLQRTTGLAVRGYLGLERLTVPEQRDLKRDLSAYRYQMLGKLTNERVLVGQAKQLGMAPPPMLKADGKRASPAMLDLIWTQEIENLRAICKLVGMKVEFIS